MIDVSYPEVLRDDIKISFRRIRDVAKVFPRLFGEPKSTAFTVIGVSNINYVLTPRASRVLPRFRLTLYPLRRYRTGRVLTTNDFVTYDLVKVSRGMFQIEYYLKRLIDVELEVEECGALSPVTMVNDVFISELPEYYETLSSLLPYELVTREDKLYNLVYFSATRIILVATTVLTFLYNVCEASDKLKFFEWPYEDSPDPEVVKYGEELIKNIKRFGNDFGTILKNLTTAGFLT
jgi:hypothetical protein